MNSGGFSSFGSPSGFNTSSNLFSNQNKPGGLFGSSTTSTANTGTSLFSSATPATSSGNTSFSFSSGASTLGAVQQTGTGNVKFQAPTGQDTITKNGSSQNITTNHQCITAMKEYESKSLEELRFEDYQANRKFPQTTSQFGSTGLFGSSTTSTAQVTGQTGGFGSTGLFGSTSTTTTAAKPFGGFGSTTTTTTPTSTSLFGQSSTASRPFGGFGSTTTATTTTSSPFSGFGSQPTTTSTFGQTQPAQQQSSIFGGLGSSGTQAQTGTGLFGSTQPSTGTTGGLFGSTSTTQANKPLFGFGQTTTQPATQPTSTFSFGGTGGTTTTTTPSTSIFGQSSLTQSPLSAAKPFGSTTLGGGFGTTGTTGGFGSTTTTTTPSTGIFGSSTQPKPAFGTGLGQTTTGTAGGFGTGFGQTTGTTTTGTTGGMFGGFGTTTPQASTTTASPFGATTTTASPFGATTTTTPSIFGQTTQPSTTTTTTGGMFGSTPSTGFGTSTLGTGFGTTQTAQTTAQPSIFGSMGTGLGGATTGGGLFGTSQTTQPTSTFGTGLTGTTGLGAGLGTGTTTSGGFGSFGLGGQTTTTTGLGTGLGLGSGLGQTQLTQPTLGLGQTQPLGLQQQQTTAQPLVQQQLLALSNSPYGTANLLRSTLQDLNKKEDIFKPVSPIAQRQYITEATSPPKSVVSTQQSLIGDFKGGLSQTLKITPKPLSQVSLNKKADLFEGLEDEEAPVFYPRKNIKKLLFKPSSSDTNLSRRSISENSSVNGDTKIDFMRPKSTQFQEDSLRYNENINFNNLTKAQITNDLTNVSDDGAANNDNQSEISVQPHPANITLERPGYFTIPSMSELASMTDSKGDCFVENFAIGRVDYGCITFPGITNLANMNLDEIIHIRRKEVHVYPDDSKKPPVGQGLNKSAEVTLHRIWPSDKTTKMPITDPNRVISMGYNKKIERATIEMGAQFIDYDPVTGSWTFKVKHFSKYGLNDSDDEDDLNTVDSANLKPILNTNTKLMKDSDTKDMSFLNQNNANKEKDMISKQLKLIEMRRFELMKSKKSNLGSITNHQWEIINEYCNVPTGISNQLEKLKSNKFIDNSNLHLELSSDEDETRTESSDQQHKDNAQFKNKTLRKALILDNDETSDNEEDVDEMDENKENNRLYPNLNDLNRKNNKLDKNKLYPNLDSYSPKLQQQQQQQQPMNFEMEDHKEIRENDLMNNETYLKQEDIRMDDLPFLASDKLIPNRKLVDAFFNDDRDVDDYYSYHSQVNEEESSMIKFGGFNQKPITVGLLKRGLGGISTFNQDNKLTIGETSVLSASLKGDQFHGQNKVVKQQNLTSLTLADVQERIGSKELKPKLWNRFLVPQSTKETNEYSDILQHEDLKQDEQTNNERLEQLNISNEVNQIVPKLIELKDSIAKDYTWCFSDAGLFNARRFRINWSLTPTAFTYTQLAPYPKNETFRNLIQISTPCMLSLSTRSTQPFDLSTNLKLNIIKENLVKYLNIQLNLTDFITEKSDKYSTSSFNSKLPFLRTKFGNDLIKQLNDCTEEIRNSIGDNPDADNIEQMKRVWSLCSNLWGDIPENYKSNLFDSSSNNYEYEQIRKRLLGEWLVHVSSHRIEKECKSLKFNKNKENYLNSIFSLLTGNRLVDACTIATENSDFRLALLLSQTSGSNDTVRTMIRKQLNEWSMSGTDKFLNTERLKLYVLIAGDLLFNLSGQKSQLINVCENLDWKRQFGLHLWYHCLPIHSITDALNTFEKSVSSQICNKPVPSYIEDTVSNDLNDEKINKKELFDTCFHLIRLYCNNTHPIEEIIDPLNHTSNCLDHRLSWHLAMALTALQYNHIPKSSMETIHDNYASQLQSIGLWHWSIFIIMHIEDERRRESFVRTYLSRHVSSESDLNENEKFLVEKLHVPCEWIYEYKALRAKYENLNENQFLLLIKAHKWNEAHNVLIEHLAPDMLLYFKYEKLQEYLSILSKESTLINKWCLGGQIYYDFIRLRDIADLIFEFSDENVKKNYVDEDLFKEINQYLMNLSSRIKEFDNKTYKKLSCSLIMAKLLLKYFNAFNELIVEQTDDNEDNDDETGLKQISESDEEDEEEEDEEEETEMNKQDNLKVFTRTIVSKAIQKSDIVPDQDLIGTMLLKKFKYTQNFMMSSSSRF